MLRKLVMFLVCAAIFAVIGVVVKGRTAAAVSTDDEWAVTYLNGHTYVTEYYNSDDVYDALNDFTAAHMQDYHVVDVCNRTNFTCP